MYYAVEFIFNEEVVNAANKTTDELLQPFRDYYSKRGVGINEERYGYFVSELEDDFCVLLAKTSGYVMQYPEFLDYLSFWTFETDEEVEDLLEESLTIFKEHPELKGVKADRV